LVARQGGAMILFLKGWADWSKNGPSDLHCRRAVRDNSATAGRPEVRCLRPRVLPSMRKNLRGLSLQEYVTPINIWSQTGSSKVPLSNAEQAVKK
jgi:hypothetical protein